MLAVDDIDRQRAAQPGKRIGAGIRNHRHGERRRAAIHDAAVLHAERAGTAVETADHAFYRDIGCGSFHRSPYREHLDNAGRLQRATEHLVEAHVRGLHAIAQIHRGPYLALDLKFAFDLRHVRLR